MDEEESILPQSRANQDCNRVVMVMIEEDGS